MAVMIAALHNSCFTDLRLTVQHDGALHTNTEEHHWQGCLHHCEDRHTVKCDTYPQEVLNVVMEVTYP